MIALLSAALLLSPVTDGAAQVVELPAPSIEPPAAAVPAPPLEGAPAPELPGLDAAGLPVGEGLDKSFDKLKTNGMERSFDRLGTNGVMDRDAKRPDAAAPSLSRMFDGGRAASVLPAFDATSLPAAPADGALPTPEKLASDHWRELSRLPGVKVVGFYSGDDGRPVVEFTLDGTVSRADVRAAAYRAAPVLRRAALEFFDAADVRPPAEQPELTEATLDRARSIVHRMWKQKIGLRHAPMLPIGVRFASAPLATARKRGESTIVAYFPVGTRAPGAPARDPNAAASFYLTWSVEGRFKPNGFYGPVSLLSAQEFRKANRESILGHVGVVGVGGEDAIRVYLDGSLPADIVESDLIDTLPELAQFRLEFKTIGQPVAHSAEKTSGRRGPVERLAAGLAGSLGALIVLPLPAYALLLAYAPFIFALGVWALVTDKGPAWPLRWMGAVAFFIGIPLALAAAPPILLACAAYTGFKTGRQDGVGKALSDAWGTVVYIHQALREMLKDLLKP